MTNLTFTPTDNKSFTTEFTSGGDTVLQMQIEGSNCSMVTSVRIDSSLPWVRVNQCPLPLLSVTALSIPAGAQVKIEVYADSITTAAVI